MVITDDLQGSSSCFFIVLVCHMIIIDARKLCFSKSYGWNGLYVRACIGICFFDSCYRCIGNIACIADIVFLGICNCVRAVRSMDLAKICMRAVRPVIAASHSIRSNAFNGIRYVDPG